MTDVISKIEAVACSFRLPGKYQVSLGIGRTVKRDAVMVRAVTDGGACGWGEAHAARSPTAIAELINSTLGPLLTGMPCDDHAGIRERVFKLQVNSHGMGTAAIIALSGIDLALWDVTGRLLNKSVVELLDGEPCAIPAYAGGVTLGFGDDDALIREAREYLARGYPALKLRIGQGAKIDGARLRLLRETLGGDFRLMTDANTSLTLNDAEQLVPILDECDVSWLEEPFPPYAFNDYRRLKDMSNVSIAAGENHYGLHDFERALDDGAISIWQPDLSKCGGLFEAIQIAKLAEHNNIVVNPHTSLSAINMASTLHFLSAIENRGYFEADLTPFNPLRNLDPQVDFKVTPQGTLLPPSGAGFGIELNFEQLSQFEVIPGPGYV